MAFSFPNNLGGGMSNLLDLNNNKDAKKEFSKTVTSVTAVDQN